MCCYQILMNSDLKKLEPDVIQFFCLSGLGLCYRIFDYWSHCFMAALFYHCMPAVLYQIGNKIYIRKYPGIEKNWERVAQQEILVDKIIMLVEYPLVLMHWVELV